MLLIACTSGGGVTLWFEWQKVNTMFLRPSLVALLLFGLSVPMPSGAASPRPADIPSKSDQTAVAAMGRFASLLKKAQTLTYAFRFQTNSPDGNVDIMRGSAEKPNKFRVEESINGKISALVVCDGQTVSVYQASTNHYRTMPALQSYADRQDRAVQAQTTDLLGPGFLPVLMFFGGNPDLLAPTETAKANAYPVLTTLLNDASHIRVSQQAKTPSRLLIGQPTFFYDFNKKTGLVQEIRLGSANSSSGYTHSLMQFNFSSFNLGAVSFPNELFSWTPPQGAILDAPSHP